MDTDHVLTAVDILSLGLVFGSTVFFFQKLMLFMGREKFVPVQMKITAWFFAYVQFPLLISLALSWRHGGMMFISSGVSAAGGAINYLFIVPQVSCD